ncbi:hypothetical protein UMZ34_03440 [Halopseudomonas pachastrellae]|nr:hypothetical protein UMZ34_03440 [Halopseudomonas pachastrellae]
MMMGEADDVVAPQAVYAAFADEQDAEGFALPTPATSSTVSWCR